MLINMPHRPRLKGVLTLGHPCMRAPREAILFMKYERQIKPVAPVTRTPIAWLYRKGKAESTATAMPAHMGVRKVGLTYPQALPNGRRPSRPIENIRRMVADWIARVQTQTAMKTTPR